MPIEKVLHQATLGFLVKPGHVLLAFKTEKIGANCWNGYGGRFELQDKGCAKACMKRELEEECGAIADIGSLKPVGLIDFHNTKANGTTFTCKVHVFLIQTWKGEPQPSKTMITPTWFEIDKLPLEKMLPADHYWLRLVLTGQKIEAKAYYGPFQKELIGPMWIQHLA